LNQKDSSPSRATLEPAVQSQDLLVPSSVPFIRSHLLTISLLVLWGKCLSGAPICAGGCRSAALGRRSEGSGVGCAEISSYLSLLQTLWR